MKTAQREGWAKKYRCPCGSRHQQQGQRRRLAFRRSRLGHCGAGHKCSQPRSLLTTPWRRSLTAMTNPGVSALVVLASCMRILTPGFVARSEGRLLEHSPVFVARLPGLHTHQRALDTGCKFAGCFVHGHGGTGPRPDPRRAWCRFWQLHGRRHSRPRADPGTPHLPPGHCGLATAIVVLLY